MDLRFQGDLTPWHGLLLALLAGFVAAAIYYREVRRQRGLLPRLLPLLRGLAVFLILLMLIAPVLHLIRIEPLHNRLLVFVDASQSMSVTDESLDPLRKVRLMTSLGILPSGAFRDDSTNDAKAAAEARKVLASKSSIVAAAVKKLDSMSRWQRVEAMMLSRPGSLGGGLLRQVADRQGIGVDVFALTDKDSPRVWWSEQSAELSTALPYKPEWPSTDLGSGIQSRTASTNDTEPAIAAVLISDGQHNTGPAPLEVAQSLGRQHLPLFVIGVGSATPPPDLAVITTEGPETVFIEDRAKGQVVLQDTMPANLPFVLRIESSSSLSVGGSENDNTAGRVVWEKRLTTTGAGLRKIDYDFPIAAVAQAEVARLSAQGIEAMNLPLAFTVTAGPIESEKNKGNNQTELMIRAIKSQRKILLMDGRPRWEYRYLRNLFERDKQWDVNSLVAGVDRTSGGWVRGNAPGAFPKDKETLMSYDVVIFGEVPLSLLRPAEIEWLKDFVGDRGGGMVFVDGNRGALRLYLSTPLGTLLPIKWQGEPSALGPWALRLTPSGQRAAALSLTSDAAANASLWQNLPGPHWIAPDVALPGAETLAEAVVGSQVVPALVTRRYGAGRVWYSATDETWRWRYEVEDLYHRRYWNQVVNFVAEPPYAVKDKFVSLDVGALRYKTGESAHIRAMVRDASGRPLPHPTAEAVLYRDGHVAATMELVADENGGGRLRGDTGPLEPGHYEAGVRVPGLSESQTRARVAFVVQGADSGEMAALTCNEELLRQMADSSGGRYFREEDAPGLIERLHMIPHTRTIETDIPLWNHWSWFGAIVGLLTIEWLLRKKWGMV